MEITIKGKDDGSELGQELAKELKQELAQEFGAEITIDPGVAAAAAPTTAEDIAVPLALFICIAAVWCLKYYFAFRTRREVQATVRAALEKGQPLTPEILDRIGEPGRQPRSDLRRGVIWTALGIGIVAFGQLVGEPDAARPMAAVGLVPFLVGLAYVVLWWLESRNGRISR